MRILRRISILMEQSIKLSRENKVMKFYTSFSLKNPKKNNSL